MGRRYDEEYKIQAVKLAKEINGSRAAKELGIPEGPIRTWLKNAKRVVIDLGEKTYTGGKTNSFVEEIAELRKRIKEQDKEINRLKKENEFLEEAIAFFAASRIYREVYVQFGEETVQTYYRNIARRCFPTLLKVL